MKFHSFNRGVHNRYPYKTIIHLQTLFFAGNDSNLYNVNQIMPINPCRFFYIVEPWLADVDGWRQRISLEGNCISFFITPISFKIICICLKLSKRDGICKCSVANIVQLGFEDNNCVCCLIRFSRLTTDCFKTQIDITAEYD